jgi:CheY-like chemotaxis protein
VTQSALRIVVADDHPDIRQTLSVLLEMEGHEVTAASNGQEAVDAARARVPDAVLLDLGMPVMDGFAAVHALRKDPRFEATFIAAITGYGDPKTRERCQQAGFNAHFVKPIQVKQLFDALEGARQ